MARVALDHQVNSLQQELVVLACSVEKAINRAVDALKRRDLEVSRRVVLEDDYIDQLRLQVVDGFEGAWDIYFTINVATISSAASRFISPASCG